MIVDVIEPSWNKKKSETNIHVFVFVTNTENSLN